MTKRIRQAWDMGKAGTTEEKYISLAGTHAHAHNYAGSWSGLVAKERKLK